MEGSNISENSRRVARNTLLLYFRMLLLMFIGLFTSRVVLRALGVADYGVYALVGEVVSVFTFITTSISAAISRFLAFELGRGDVQRLRRVFSTSITIQAALSLLLVLLVETVGLWMLRHRLDIPADRMDAAFWTLQCAIGVLVVNLMAVPYNASIIAHEKMSAFAAISIVEAMLKLAVALLLYLTLQDKLICYSILMLGVALIVRLSYAIYCRRNFLECRARLGYDPELLKEMGGFAGWSFFGATANVFNTRGVSIVTNIFFGVIANAARGVAAQVENIVRQFMANIITALTPQITKSYAAGDRQYSFSLVCKGIKFSALVVLFFLVPLFFEAEQLLALWLGDSVPPMAAVFVRLTVLCLLLDLAVNPLLHLQLATGKVRTYYLVTGTIAFMVFPLSWIAFRMGAPAHTAYQIYICVYVLLDAVKLVIVHRSTGFPVKHFLLNVLLPLTLTAAAGFAAAWAAGLLFAAGSIARLLAVLAAGSAAICVIAWMLLLTQGEKSYIKTRIGCRG